MKKMLLLLALVCLVLVLSSPPANAQGAISVTNTTFKIDYPNTMDFGVKATGPSPITTIDLVVRFPGGTTTRLKSQFVSGTNVNTSVIWTFKATPGSSVGGYLPPGAHGTYSWHVEDQAGNKYDSPATPFHVDDNRRQWSQLKNDRITFYWYDGGQNFGQQIFDKANKTLGAIEQDIGATLTDPVEIYIYGDRDEFLSALGQGNHEWAGGTINEQFNVVLINADHTMLDYALSTTPHELTHVVLGQALKGPYADLMPIWMNEGIAVYHEYIPPHNEPRFESALQQGIQSDTLLRLKNVAGNQPNDENVVDMFYGESYSVVAFMVKTYGRDKMNQLIQLFKEGTADDAAFQQVLGVDTDGLENAWRKSVGAQTKNYPKAATPTPGALPTLGFSSAETPNASSGSNTPTPVPVAQTQPTVISPNPAPTPAPAGGGGLCGLPIGVMGLVVFGLWMRRRAA